MIQRYELSEDISESSAFHEQVAQAAAECHSNPLLATPLEARQGYLSSWKECDVIDALSLGQSSRGRTSWPQAQTGTQKPGSAPTSPYLAIHNSFRPHLSHSATVGHKPSSVPASWAKDRLRKGQGREGLCSKLNILHVCVCACMCVYMHVWVCLHVYM